MKALSIAVLLSLCLAPRAFGQEAHTETKRLILPVSVFAGAALADVLTTNVVLQRDGIGEANPVLRVFGSERGPVIATATAAYVGGTTAWVLLMGRHHPKLAAVGLYVAAAVTAGVAMHNANLAAKHPR